MKNKRILIWVITIVALSVVGLLQQYLFKQGQPTFIEHVILAGLLDIIIERELDKK